MTTRGAWAAIPGLLALAVGAVMLSAYSGASSSQGRGPVQPINFPHPLHVQTLRINCLYCHYSANKSPDPGLPAVGTCMGCHLVVGAANPEIKKLATYAATNKPIPWVRIHKVPEYVHFPHMRHVNAGVTCQACHGQIQGMARVYQYASLNMGWCVRCHVNGYSLKEGLQAAGYAPADTGAPGVAAASSSVAGSAVLTASTDRRKARYDCASCHY